MHIYGHVVKKELDFRQVIEESFGEVRLADLLRLIH